VQLALEVGLQEAVSGDSASLRTHLVGSKRLLDIVIDTVGSADSIQDSLSILDKSGTLVLLAVHKKKISLAPICFSGERRIMTSANNKYRDFPRAIELMASGKIKVKPLITHHFALREAPEAFQVMLHKNRERAYKVVLHPESS
jgi:threonine dehydrogenase-like Zn-dependent dehydrogenase